MIKLFSEKVNSTFTSSGHNILTVESYDEVFFDVFEFEINGTKYIAEKLSVYKGSPVVSIPVVENEIKKNVPFVLMEGAFEVVYNGDETPEEADVVDEIAAIVAEEKIDVALEYKDDLLQEIAEAKQLAAEYADRIKLQKIEEADKTIEEKKQDVKNFFDTTKVDLLDEFNAALVNNKQDLETYTEQKHSEIEKYLTSRIENNFSEFFDINNDRLAEISTVIESVENRITSDISTTVDQYDVLVTEKIKKGVDKALGRVGNVKTSVSDLESQLLNKIETVDDNIREYYDTRISNIRDEVDILTESQKDYFINLVEDSKTYLLEQIKQDKEKTVETLIQEKYDPEKGDKEFVKSIKKLKADLDKEIADRFRNEVTSVRRLIGLSGGGGGTVAKQFADGGIMRGDLEVKGCVTAECFITSNPNSDDYSRAGIFRDGELLKDVANNTCTFPININPALSTAKFQVTYTSSTGRSFIEVWIGHMDGNCYVSGYSVLNSDEVNPLLISVDCSIVDECLNIISYVSSDCTGVFSGNAVYVDDPSFVL